MCGHRLTCCCLPWRQFSKTSPSLNLLLVHLTLLYWSPTGWYASHSKSPPPATKYLGYYVIKRRFIVSILKQQVTLVPSFQKSKYLLELPSEPDRNPYHHLDQLPVCTHFSRIGGFQPSQSFKAHSYAVTDVDIHPNRPHLATASDDHHWKLWSLTR